MSLVASVHELAALHDVWTMDGGHLTQNPEQVVQLLGARLLVVHDELIGDRDPLIAPILSKRDSVLTCQFAHKAIEPLQACHVDVLPQRHGGMEVVACIAKASLFAR